MGERGTLALVVGNSDGIGLALTKRLLAKGWTVTGVSRSVSPIEDTSYAHSIADVGRSDYHEHLRELQSRRGPFDACIYCAGIGDVLTADMDLSADAEVFRVNLVGAVQTAQVVLPPMIAAARGHFIGLSSLADGLPSSDAPSYAASKAGLSSYLAGLALALRPRGVFVSNVRFGFVDTKMAKARVKPAMLTVEQAVNVVMRCIEKRPARVTRPWQMAAIAWILRWVTSVRLWFS
jgi:NAD(P)-dependent dehydrogenase (short-subunit alcohol dehydrogenase family)